MNFQPLSCIECEASSCSEHLHIQKWAKTSSQTTARKLSHFSLCRRHWASRLFSH